MSIPKDVFKTLEERLVECRNILERLESWKLITAGGVIQHTGRFNGITKVPAKSCVKQKTRAHQKVSGLWGRAPTQQTEEVTASSGLKGGVAARPCCCSTHRPLVCSAADTHAIHRSQRNGARFRAAKGQLRTQNPKIAASYQPGDDARVSWVGKV